MQQILNLLTSLNNQANYRTLTPQQHKNLEISHNQKWLLNLASNDYLNLASNENLKESFLDSEIFRKNCFFSASSSRSLSGNFEIYAIFEEFLESLFDKKALLFNSGYHANIGIISSLNHLKNVLFLVDKSIHASHIDGLKSFKKLNFKRFLHNDMQSLTNLLEKYHNHYEAIFILSEGIFSIEGDFAKLQNLIGLKHRFKNVYLYLDEAHSIGSFGDNGLGLAHSLDYLKDIDFLILTFGKAIGSVGACVLCNQTFKEYFINTARSLIYSTALPPLNVAMSYFIFSRLHSFKKQRKALKTLSLNFKSSLESLELFEVLGDYNILSIVLKENQKTIFFQQKLQECGFFLPAIKPPTTAKNRACLRISLCANIPQERLEILIKSLLKINNEYLSRYKKIIIKIYLIFGGFGSQPHHFTPFFPDNLIIIYHYQHLNFTPLENLLTSLTSEQTEVEIYAFSMGVWVANLFLQNYNPLIFTKKIAINGTEFGIDNTYGIPLKAFKLTQKIFNLEHFKTNLLGQHSYKAQHLSFLDEESLKKELGFFISNHKAFQQGSTWDKVIISKADLIFSTSAQKSFWIDFKGYQKQILWLDSPHFVFFDWKFL